MILFQSGAEPPPVAPPPPGSQITSLTLNSATTGTLPFTFGLGFRKGDALNPAVNASEYQLVVKRRWNDGSAKHAIVSGQAAMVGGTPLVLTVHNAGSAPAGTALTPANIAAAAPAASVQCGAIGTVNLASLLAAPFRTWVSGPEMVECHYRANVGADPVLSVWFHVRLFKAGRIWIRAIVENGYLQGTGASVKSYVPTVIVGGATVFNNGGATLDHWGNTRWSVEGWIGGDPQVTPQHDTIYLNNAKYYPNYWKRNPSAAALNGLPQTYTPMGPGGYPTAMGAAGYQQHIGLLGLWDALHQTSHGDARAYRAVLAQSSSLNSFPMVWRDPVTQLVPKPSAYPVYVIFGGTFDINTGGPLTWDMNHEPPAGYLAYLLTGDYWHYETALLHCATSHFCMSAAHGTGLNRLLWSAERGLAWNWRNFAQIGAISPTGDAVADEYRTELQNNVVHYKAVKDAGGAGLGYLFAYDLDAYVAGGEPVGTTATWMNHFITQTMGMGSDLEPLVDMTAWNDVRDSYYKAAVGITGDATGYCFAYASADANRISNTSDELNPATWYQTWAQVFANTPSLAGKSYISAIQIQANSSWRDIGAGEAFFTHFGNYLPAIAYAVEHAAPGAIAAWGRLTGASNWASTIDAGGGFQDVPIWGIVPRSFSPPA